MIQSKTDPVSFGTYALSPVREALRRCGAFMPSHKLGRMAISTLRKLALLGKKGRFDITLNDGLNVRLYPANNRCEKRAFCGVHIWDAVERAAIEDELKHHKGQTPFIFLDIGANVGLYTLFTGAIARKLAKPCYLLAVEPDETNAARLQFNAEASNLTVHLRKVGISGKQGQACIAGGETNRGEITLRANTDQSLNTISVITLHMLCEQEAVTQIDAMKVDIEGHDLDALRAFFEEADPELHPKLLIIETGRGASPVLDLCLKHNYTLQERAGINAILRRQDKAASHMKRA